MRYKKKETIYPSLTCLFLYLEIANLISSREKKLSNSWQLHGVNLIFSMCALHDTSIGFTEALRLLEGLIYRR